MHDDKAKYLDILRKLIAFKSVTPKGKEALDYISALLQEYGFKIDLQKFGQGEKETWNLYAYRGNSAPNICFAGHVDVVPPGSVNSWSSDPFILKMEADNLQGRGIVDMKGAIACSLAATIKYITKFSNHKGTISFLLTTDEEGSGEFGTKMMLEYIANKYAPIDFCILGEPTSEKKIGDMVKIGRRGSISFDLTINGTQGHVAYPDLANNPITRLVNAMNELKFYELDSGTDFFSPSNLEITTIDVNNDTTNVIPEKCYAKFNIRFNDKHSAESLLELVKLIINKHSDDYDLKHSCSSHPFIQEYSANMQSFVEVIKEQCNINPVISTSGGTSDARHIHKFAEVIEFGLNSDQAHQINECCQNYDLQMLCNVYYAYLVKSL